MESKQVRYILIGLLLVSLAIKVHPSMSHDFLVNFDSIYHTRIGQMVAMDGWVPAFDPVAGGRPHLYPPMYHLILGYGSTLTGIPVFELIQYILPLISALLILPTFYIIRKYRDVQTALWGAAFMAFSPIVTSQSFDSPQVFGLLLFPLIVYAFLKGKYFIGGVLLAVTILFNYGIALMIGAVLLIFAIVALSKGNKDLIVYAGLIGVIGVGLVSPWLFISASRSSECLDLSTAVVSVNESAVVYLWMMLPFIAVIGIGLLYLLRKSNDEYILLWKTAFAVGTVGFVLSLFFPELHPYDQIMLFGFSMPFLLAELKWRKEYKLGILAVFLVWMLFSVSAVVPALSDGDVAAAEWVAEKEGRVLANLEISGTINMIAMGSVETVFDQFLECIPNRERWVDMHETLLSSDVDTSRVMLEQYGIDYVVVGARDVWHYGFDIEKFKELGEEVYSSGGTKIYSIK